MGIHDRPLGVRPEKLLHGWRDPVVPLPAATVILVRDGPSGPQVMMTRRSLRASFAPGAYVFPGGRVDTDDHELAVRFSSNAADVHDNAFVIAAIRESFEELGLLLARDADGRWANSDHVVDMDRGAGASFGEQLARHRLVPAIDALHWFSHWVTDRDLPKRFDTRFFVAAMPPGQSPVADESEQFEPIWVNPTEGLARHEAGEFDIIFPTIRTLRQLQSFRSVQALLSHARELVLEPDQSPSGGEAIAGRDMSAAASTGLPASTFRFQSSPRAGMLNGQIERFIEDESPYGELELVSPDGRAQHVLDWQHEPVRLLRHVTRITAPNPGRMTGPGTNTYVIGDSEASIVLDPGPDLPEHLQRIADVTGKKLRAIICTHSHPDHYPGAIPLRTLVGQPDVPILGMRAGPHFNPAWHFEPDRELIDGESITCGDSTLKVIHTPGHASNHVCLLLVEDGLLFSGDHILNGSTTVIDHPDGDMTAYLLSLARLRREASSFILPAHGHVLGHPARQIDALIRHRLRREAKVLATVRASGGGDLDTLVKLAYDDVDPILHPIAKRSLTAHLVKLAAESVVVRDDTRWLPAATSTG